MLDRRPGSSALSGLSLPAEIVVRDPGAVAAYVRVHPDLASVVSEMAAALVSEFRGERSEIGLVLYRDPEIDDRQLTLYVRVPEYGEMLMPRLDAVWERVDSRFPPTPDWVFNNWAITRCGRRVTCSIGVSS